jgi:hypothetical protein
MLCRFLIKPDVGVFYRDEQTTHPYASVHRQPRQQGTPIPTESIVDRRSCLAAFDGIVGLQRAR